MPSNPPIQTKTPYSAEVIRFARSLQDMLRVGQSKDEQFEVIANTFAQFGSEHRMAMARVRKQVEELQRTLTMAVSG